jgi:hypothetical protein
MNSYITEYEKRLKLLLKDKTIRSLPRKKDVALPIPVKNTIYDFFPSEERKRPISSIQTYEDYPEDTGGGIFALLTSEEEEEEEKSQKGGFITKEEVAILSRIGTQYSDTIINCFGDLLQKQQLLYFGYTLDRNLSWKKKKARIVQPKIVVLFTTFLYEHIRTQKKKEALSHCNCYLRNIDLNQACTIVFPINLGNYHWVAVVLKDGIMTYYDSLNFPLEETAHECMTNVETFMSWYKGFQEMQILYRRKVYVHKHPQRDNCSCGVYVCHRMLTASEHRLDEELLDVNQFRTYMKRKLLP